MVPTSRWQIICLFVIFILALQVNAKIRLQPIGIDLGPEIVTAAYAYDTDNVTIISTLNPDVDGSFRDTMLRLQLLYAQERPSLFGKQKPATTGALTTVKNVVQSAASFIQPYLPHLDYVGVPPWVTTALSAAVGTVSIVFGARDSHLVDPVPAEDIKREFVTVLRQVKAHARTDHNIRIRSAIFSAPSFFNSTLTDLIVEAAEEVGIWTSPMVLPRTIAVTYAQDNDPNGEKGIRYLIIDQGEYYCDLRTAYTGNADSASAIKGILLPMEPFASASINRRLAEKLISKSKDLQTQVAWGANRGDIWQPIKKARFLIRDDIDSEITGQENTDGHHFDEYPLDLQDWGDGSAQAVLKWEDVQDAEEEFVDALASNIMSVMVALREWRDSETSNEAPEEVDCVVILTSHYDGQLIKRAVQSVIGNSVGVIGGTVRGYQLAAIGAAQVALTTKKAWGKPGQWKNHDEL